MPIQREATAQNILPVTALVTFVEDKTSVVLVLKPTHLSHFKVKRGIKRFHISHEPTINTKLLRQLKANNNNNNLFRLCLKRVKLAKRRRHFCYRFRICTIHIVKFEPIEFVISIGIKSMDDNSNVNANDKQANGIGKVDEQFPFDGSENSYERLQNEAYYHSQVAVGDPIRSKRIKRIHSTKFNASEQMKAAIR